MQDATRDRERPDEEPRGDGTVSRRRFVKGAAATATLATVATFWLEGMGDPSRRRRIEPTRPGAPLAYFTDTEFRTIEAMTDRLLPSSPGSPGARDVNTAGYFDAIFAKDPIPAGTQALVRHNLELASTWARESGAEEFARLSPKLQDDVIRRFERDAYGVRFLRAMLEFTLECFFGDPVHGGNVDGIAWQWAHHKPGSPRPTEPNWAPRERT
jgi:hypothetical protein